ncbi:mandelate racemase/muconate lactonizing enzyme family protein [Litorivicinus lipolyticus]|uniref:Mandelate racemase/muconate lactonizing enzyme family protein n=1 Tax=Litorivicinus lipolyticus TaxID=418701 RepID=A0A5Q2QEY3_9GAMM|nr:mandelate racemase/muconate lactonizing enzyme family protein [Litorivicinus lipolyticus]QGG80410.1 mandelate racemase/muconate lactonizing enzyme family protein [Litorivicinus lipolyticus]
MIANATLDVLRLPLAKPMSTAIHRTDAVYCVALSVETDRARGESFVFSLNPDRAMALRYMIQSLLPIYQNQDEQQVQTLWDAAMLDINPVGTQGFAVSAISAWDTAVWDAIGHSADQPLADLFGRQRDRISAYASSGLWLNQSIDQLIEEAHGFVNQGFRAVKLRVDGRIARDQARAAALRSSLGPDIEILVDANQSLTEDNAIALAHALAPSQIGWLEEPVLAADLDAQARVKAASPIPIASGETDYTARGMARILAQDCTDVLMPDLQRIGGLSEMRRVSAMAEAAGVPISTHIFTEYSLSIAAASAGCISVEHVDWFADLFQAPIQIEQGQALLPRGAGTGFRFARDRFADWRFNH